MLANILIGTCSWTDSELIKSGEFYPSEVKTAEERLRYYASQFPVVEVDSSYYAIPSERNAVLWAERTPPEFTFDVKVFRLFTHHPTPWDAFPKRYLDSVSHLAGKKNLYFRDVPEDAREQLWWDFVRALEPLKTAGKLGAVILQFPPWFQPTSDSRDHISWLRERLADIPGAVEFRNNIWLNEPEQERTLRFLEGTELGFVCVDEPQGFRSSAPPIAAATSGKAFVRFHGRNTETWERRTATTAERFDWWYKQEEFEEWVPRVWEIADRSEEVHLLMNTNRFNQAPVNANQLRMVLHEAGIG